MSKGTDARETGARLRESIEREAAAAEADDEVQEDEPEAEPVDEPTDELADDELEADEPTDELADDELEADEPEPADEPADDGPSMERQAELLGAIMEGFEASLRELFGVDEPLVEIPMDGALGYMLPGSLEFRTHEKFRRCSTCNGHGQVMTGSLADGQQTANCPRCGGRGYLEKVEELAPTDGNAPAEPAAAGDPDAGYGTPAWMGNPAIGQNP